MKNLNKSSTSEHIYFQKLERMKILCLFAFVLFISCAFGCAIANYISAETYGNYLFRISTHFETVFLKCSRLVDCARIVAIYSLPDVISILVVFAASLSICNYLITNIVLLYNGIKFGITFIFLTHFNFNNSLYMLEKSKIFIFVLVELITISLLLYYSYQAALSSVELRQLDSNGRSNIKTKDFLQFSLKTIACVGGVFILNTFYCGFIYLLK